MPIREVENKRSSYKIYTANQITDNKLEYFFTAFSLLGDATFAEIKFYAIQGSKIIKININNREIPVFRYECKLYL
jgi:hypothetical protein